MNHYTKLIAILLMLLIHCYACQEQRKTDPMPEEWEVLEIKTENSEMLERIGILHSDSCIYSKIDYDSIYFKKHGKYFSETYHFYLSREDKEALHLLFVNAIEQPVGTTTKVSCNAGENITLTLNKYGDPEISCHYSSVRNIWNISKTMLEIKRLAFKNIKHRKDA